MSSSESEHDIKKMEREREPLCLFCYPYDTSDYPCEGEPYVAGSSEDAFGKVKSERLGRRKWSVKKGKQEMWLRRRKEMSMKRKRRALEAGRHLKSYLLMSVRPTSNRRDVYIPCLIEALETVKDAWAPHKRFSTEGYLDEDGTPGERVRRDAAGRMLGSETYAQVPFGRRSSMPEEFMRKYLLRKATTSEESETNQTVPDVISASSKDVGDRACEELAKDIAAWNELLSADRSQVYWNQEEKGDAEEFRSKKKGPEPSDPRIEGEERGSVCRGEETSLGKVKRAVQNEYDKQGRGIIRVKTKEIGSQTGRFSGRSETSPTARDVTEDSHTSESLPSSSPVELPRQTVEDVSTSGNLSSESEEFSCTCAEITSSKDTSTDLFRSGNSTLSQTVSEKSMSTQDSTVSIHSVSTGGSTVSANSNSNSSSPDIFVKTSAKETTSPEQTPKLKDKGGRASMRSKRNLRRILEKKCGKFHRRRPHCRWHYRSKRRVACQVIEEKELRDGCSTQENPKAEGIAEPSHREAEKGKEEGRVEGEETTKADEGVGPPEYKWTRYTSEEIYMMQQMRHRKFVENYRRFSIPLPATPDTGSLGACAASGSAYKEQQELEERVLIPRYSALPRTLSMLVNTSSGDASGINSDSDSLSLADSLEDFPVVHVHQISYDTKKEQKPVRGDVNASTDTVRKVKKKHPRPRAFFVSIKEPYGEDELLSGITKIPEPPDRIKDRINRRQLYILSLQKRNSEKRKEEERENKRHRKDLRGKGMNLKERKDKRFQSVRVCGKRREDDEKGAQTEMTREAFDAGRRRSERKDSQEMAASKIPVAVGSASTSTSPERGPVLPHRRKKTKKEKKGQSRTDADRGDRPILSKAYETKLPNISETSPAPDSRGGEEAHHAVPQNGSSSATKPQAIIHPSPVPTSEPDPCRRNRPMSINQARGMRFRQKFEAIPEEKSSSLSSTEEKKGSKVTRTSLPAKPSPSGGHSSRASESDRSTVRNYTQGSAPNLIFAKFMGKSVPGQRVPGRGSNIEQPIILFSPKEMAKENSRKGRDALIAMNREDFNRLSKGWMNFYMLKETSDGSEGSAGEEREEGRTSREVGHPSGRSRQQQKSRNETVDEKRFIRNLKEDSGTRPHGGTKTSDFVVKEEPENHELMCPNSREGVQKEEGPGRGVDAKGELGKVHAKEMKKILGDCLRFHTSNTILKPIRATPRAQDKRLSLPELNVSFPNGPPGDHHSKDKRSALVLPKVPQNTADYDGMDSDSTVYCQPPSFIVPRLSFDGSDDFPSEGSISGSNSESEEAGKKTVPLPAKYVPLRKRGASQRQRPKKEGNAEVSKCGSQGYSGWSVTVAGTVELTTAAPDLEMRLSFPANGCGPPQASQSDSGFAEEGSRNAEPSSRTDGRGTIASNGGMKQRWTVTVKNPKEGDGEGVRRKFGKSNVLPSLGQPQPRKNLKVLKSHTLAGNETGCSGRISIYYPKVEITRDEWIEEVVKQDELSVRGAAMPMEKKPRPPTMTERDLTRGLTARSGQSDPKYAKG